MKKTKLLTSLAALALVLSLGSCETGDVIINVGDVDLGGGSSEGTSEDNTSEDDTSGNTSESDDDDTTSSDTSSGTETGEVNTLYNYTFSVAFYDADGAQTTIPEYASAYIIGDWDNWANFLPLTEKEDKTYEYTFSSIDVGSYEYKGVMWYSDEDVSWDVSPVEIITGTGSNGNATLEVLASEGDNYTKYTSATLSATLEEKGGDTGQGGDDPETKLISNLIATVNQLVEECDDEDGLSVWEAIHVEENDVEDDSDYIMTTRTYDLGTDEDVAFGVVSTYTSNDNYTTTRYYNGQGKYYEKTTGGYGSGSSTGIHSTSQGNTYASIADILGYYLEDYLGAIDDSGTLEDYTSESDEFYYGDCYRYTIYDGNEKYCYYIDEDGEFIRFIYDNGEEAYEDGWENVEFTPTTEEAVNAKLAELDYETWPVSGVQLQFTFNLDGVAQTIPEGVTLYYEENSTRTAIESSADRYVINPSSLEQGSHSYSIVLVADQVEETIGSGTYDIDFDDSGKIKQLTINLTQSFEDYLGGEEEEGGASIYELDNRYHIYADGTIEVHQVEFDSGTQETGHCVVCGATGLRTDRIDYAIDSEGHAYVSKMNSTSYTDFYVVQTYNGATVTGIGDASVTSEPSSAASDAFCRNATIQFVGLPNTITDINNYAFSRCDKLTTVNIPDSVTYIGKRAFYNDQVLNGITLPDGLLEIQTEAFYNCYVLSTIDSIPDSVTYLGEAAFRACRAITTFTLPDNVELDSKGYQFAECTSLTSVNVPASATVIPTYFVQGCTSLESFTIPSTVVELKDRVFQGCTALASIEIPSSVTTIGSYEFYNCSALESITIPDSVTSIGTATCQNCTSLETAVLGSGIITITANMFNGCTSLTTITIPASITSIGSNGLNNCSALTTVYYGGTAAQWETLSSGVTVLEGVTVIYYNGDGQ